MVFISSFNEPTKKYKNYKFKYLGLNLLPVGVNFFPGLRADPHQGSGFPKLQWNNRYLSGRGSENSSAGDMELRAAFTTLYLLCNVLVFVPA